MRQLYIHIGCHQTGSTSFQVFLRRNIKALAQAGYCYPRALKSAQHSLARLAEVPRDSLKTEQRVSYQLEADYALRQLRVSTLDYGILSSEDLSWLQDIESIQRFCDLVGDIASEIRIVYAVRRQDLLATSHHQQGLKGWARSYRYYGGVGGPFEKALQQDWDYLDFYARYQAWGEIFGVGNIAVQIFESEYFLEDSLIKQLLWHLGLTWNDDFKLPLTTNESLSASAQLLLEQVDEMWPVLGRPKSKARRLKLTALVKEYDAQQTLDTAKLWSSRTEAVAFSSHFDVSNELLRQAVFPEQTRLFSEDFSMYPEPDGRNQVSMEAYTCLLAHVASKVSFPAAADAVPAEKTRET